MRVIAFVVEVVEETEEVPVERQTFYGPWNPWLDGNEPDDSEATDKTYQVAEAFADYARTWRGVLSATVHEVLEAEEITYPSVTKPE